MISSIKKAKQIDNDPFVFVINESSKIVIKLDKKIDFIDCCYPLDFVLMQGENEFSLGNEHLSYFLEAFLPLLKSILKNEVTLDKSIIDDIGLESGRIFYKSWLSGGLDAVYKDNADSSSWVGEKACFWGNNDHVVWIYNDNEGDISLKLTKPYPNHYIIEDEDLFKQAFESWEKNYKTIFFSKITKETVRQWINQIEEIYDQMQINIAVLKDQLMKKKRPDLNSVATLHDKIHDNIFNFVLNDNERIEIQLQPDDSFIHFDYRIKIIFYQKDVKYLIGHYNLGNLVSDFNYLLNCSLNNNLLLDPHIIEDIGLAYAKASYKSSYQKENGVVYKNDEDKEKVWSGNKNLLWISHFITWIYNNNEGEIILKMTPMYPNFYLFQNDELFKEEYEKWIKNYKPFLIRTIPQKVAERWLKQTEEILEQIRQNIEQERREHEPGGKES